MKMIDPLSFPFLLAVNGDKRINLTRIVEAVITAVVVGTLVSYAAIYVALPVINEKIEQINRRQNEQMQYIRDIKQELDLRAARRDVIEAQLSQRITEVQVDVARQRR